MCNRFLGSCFEMPGFEERLFRRQIGEGGVEKDLGI